MFCKSTPLAKINLQPGIISSTHPKQRQEAICQGYSLREHNGASAGDTRPTKFPSRHLEAAQARTSGVIVVCLCGVGTARALVTGIGIQSMKAPSGTAHAPLLLPFRVKRVKRVRYKIRFGLLAWDG